MTEPHGAADSTCGTDGLNGVGPGVPPDPEPSNIACGIPGPPVTTLTNGTTDLREGEAQSATCSTIVPGAGPAKASVPSEAVNMAPANKSPDLPNGGVFRNGTSFLKSKNYKAGSKINQLADMLAKRSQNFVEASQNVATDLLAPCPENVATDLLAPCPDFDCIKEPAIPDEESKLMAEQPPPSPSPVPPVETRLEPPATPPIALDDYENSTKARVVKTRTSPRCKVEADSQQTDSVVKRGKTKTRKNKQLVEMSTQTADIQFISVRTEDETTHSLPLPVSVESHTFVCLYCHSTFSERRDCKTHELSHSQKRKTKCIKCQFCSKKLPNLDELKLHATKVHSSQFHFCSECDIRFVDEAKLTEHSSVEHIKPIEAHSEKTPVLSTKKLKLIEPALNVDVSFEGTKKPSPSPRGMQRLSPRDRTDEQYEAEMLFYSHLSGNIQENLSKHLDGKIDQSDSIMADSTDPLRTKSSSLLPLVASSTSFTPVCRAPSPYQTRSKTPNPLPMSAKKFKKLPNWQQKFWEKYNFPTSYRYEHRFWDKNYLNIEKSSLYLKDLSCLDIKTQLTMRANAKKLEESNTLRQTNEDVDSSQSFPFFLNLTPRQVVDSASNETVASPPLDSATQPTKKGKGKRKSRPSGQGSVVTRLQSVGDGGRQRKGSLDLSGDKKMSLRRQLSLENLDGKKQSSVVAVEEGLNLASKEPEASDEIAVETSEITGEWVRPRSYLCGACHNRFNNLWELEDHKYHSHPNVYCNHYEFDDDKLKNVFKLESPSPQIPQIKLPDLYRRYLEPQGALNSAEAQPTIAFPQSCSKCKKSCLNMSDLHKHMLDCGGDTTWFLTMYSSPNPNMKRKWRPFGSRRRKQIGRRCLKRSVPPTPVPRNYCTQPKVRTKPGDVETIQKMLANLPEKRTRRAINFDEISTRSQTTIQNNRLLRKRLNATFTSSFLRKKSLTRMRLNPKAKFYSEPNLRTPSATSSDLSSETTPVATPPPRRKYHLKEVLIDITPVDLGETSKGSSLKATTTKKPKKAAMRKKPAAVTEIQDEAGITTDLKPSLKIPKRNAAARNSADMVKRIKKKLRNSRRLLEARQVKKESKRRSGRNKAGKNGSDLGMMARVDIKDKDVLEATQEVQLSAVEKRPVTKSIKRRAKGLRWSLKKRSRPKVAKSKPELVADDSLEDVPLNTIRKDQLVSLDVEVSPEKRSPRRGKATNLDVESETEIDVVNVTSSGEEQTPIAKNFRRGKTGDLAFDAESVVRKRSPKKTKEVEDVSLEVTGETVGDVLVKKRPLKKRPTRKGRKKITGKRNPPKKVNHTVDDVDVDVVNVSPIEMALKPAESINEAIVPIEIKRVVKKRFVKKKTFVVKTDAEMELALTINDTLTIEGVSERRSSSRLSKPKPEDTVFVKDSDETVPAVVKPEDVVEVATKTPLVEEITVMTSRRNSRTKAPVLEEIKTEITPSSDLATVSVKVDPEDATAMDKIPVLREPLRRTSRPRRSSSEVFMNVKLNKEGVIAKGSVEDLLIEKPDVSKDVRRISRNRRSSVEGSKEDLCVEYPSRRSSFEIAEAQPIDAADSNRRSPRVAKTPNLPLEAIELTVSVTTPDSSPVKTRRLSAVSIHKVEVEVAEQVEHSVDSMVENPVRKKVTKRRKKGLKRKTLKKQDVVLPNGSDATPNEPVVVEPILKKILPRKAVKRFFRKRNLKAKARKAPIKRVEQSCDVLPVIASETLIDAPAELKEMPVLEKAESVQKVKESAADEEFPVLKPFADVEGEGAALIRFKIVKKPKKNSFSKVKVSPLKIVKEKAPIKPLVATRTKRAINGDLELNITKSQVEGAKPETDDSGSDSEPLSKLQKDPVVVRQGRKKIEVETNKEIESQSVNRTTSLTEVVETDIAPHMVGEASSDKAALAIETHRDNSPPKNMQDVIMEKIISDKLNEGRMKKRRDASGHKRGKKHQLKRLRMTVTLKEATLKVLDKPATPLNPYKWTVSASANERINFEVPSNTEASKPLQVFPVVLVAPKEIEPALLASEANEEPMKAIMQDKVDVTQIPQGLEKKEASISVAEMELSEKLISKSEATVTSEALPLAKNIAGIPEQEFVPQSSSSSDSVKGEIELRVGRRFRKDTLLGTKPALVRNSPRKSIEEVSTSVPVPEGNMTNLLEAVYKPSLEIPEASSQPIDLSMGNKVIERNSPDLTIEEATSSEDSVPKKIDLQISEVTAIDALKIAEADSSAMADDECPLRHKIEGHASGDIISVDMEPVVSSTGPAIQPLRKKRRVRSVAPQVETKEDVPSTTLLIPEELDRRTRRRSKEVPRSSEFIIDDPLILVDELWSELDSDSDSKQRRKMKKVKKRVVKKKDTTTNDIDLEALLRNFGTNKANEEKEALHCQVAEQMVKCLRRKDSTLKGPTSRQQIERKVVIKENAYKRLSLRLFTFNKKVLRHGHKGCKLLKVKKVLYDAVTIPQLSLPSSEVTENPEQVIVCRSSKVKLSKKAVPPPEPKLETNIQLKVSLPLDLLGDLSMLNNNNVRERAENLNVPEVAKGVVETPSRPITPDVKLDEPKPIRSDVIDKIFSCDICQTYYYTSSQLKNHKMSNRHKLKEAEVREGGSEEAEVAPNPTDADIVTPSATAKAALEEEKSGEDTSEMPVLEGPFIETGNEPRPDHVPKRSLFGFSEESLKDFQKAIGCTDEEMLILSLLGENAAAEQDRIDVEKRVKIDSVVNSVKGNGSLQSDLKQRMTSALAGLVNRAVNNLLKKSETAIGTPSLKNERAAFLSKLSELNDRKQKALLQLARIQDEPAPSEIKEKAPPSTLQGRYKYQCTICGNRFEKESTRDYHLIRTHRQGKRPKSSSAARSPVEELTPPSEDWNDSWLDVEDEQDPCGIPPTQFWCSDCGINFMSPKEVRDHQRLEHPPSTAEDSPRVRTPVPKRSDLNPDQERFLAKQELQKLSARRYSRRYKGNQTMWGSNSVKYKPSKTDSADGCSTAAKTSRTSDISLRKMPDDRFKKIVDNNMKRKAVEDGNIEENALDGSTWKQKKSMDVYDFNDSESDAEPVVLSHVRKSMAPIATKTASEDEDSDDIPLSSVKTPVKSSEPLPATLTPPDTDEGKSKAAEVSLIFAEENVVALPEETPESFKISLESRLLRLDEISLKKTTPPPSLIEDCDASRTLDDGVVTRDESTSSPSVLRRASEESHFRCDSDDQISENVIYQRNDSDSSYDSQDDGDNGDGNGKLSDSDDESSTISEVEDDSTASEGLRRTKKIVPLLTATLTNSVRNSESPKLDKGDIVKKIWNRKRRGRQTTGGTDESQSSEIDKETIMKRIWKKKRAEAEEEEKRIEEEMKINQTEVSDEVVIKCGPKPKPINRRKSANETAKDMIVTRIWSGKCGFQTKAALKTYESDIVPSVVTPAKRRGRPASISNVKRKRVVSASEDDLDSLLEEIEQENVEKAIRLEFLHLRRSEKSQIDNSKEPAGLFTETNLTAPDKKRRRIRRNVRVLKRREDLAELRNRKHRRHRHHHHQHHHRKHKHKKSRHHKRILSKHKSKHRAGPKTVGGIKVLERMCEDIATRGDSEPTTRSISAGRVADSRVSTDLDNLDSKIDEVLSPLATFGKRVNGEVSEIFGFPSEDDSNQCSSNKEP